MTYDVLAMFRKSGAMTRGLERLRAWLSSNDRPFDRPPDDPYSYVREPRRRTPGGKSAAVAVEEPD